MRGPVTAVALASILVSPACTTSDDAVDDGDPVATSAVAAQAAAELALALGCDDVMNEDPRTDADPPPLPVDAVSCHIGDAQFSVETYAGADDVAQVIENLAPFCGQRALGPTWIVEVDTIESAQLAATVLGGQVFVSPGCNP